MCRGGGRQGRMEGVQEALSAYTISQPRPHPYTFDEMLQIDEKFNESVGKFLSACTYSFKWSQFHKFKREAREREEQRKLEAKRQKEDLEQEEKRQREEKEQRRREEEKRKREEKRQKEKEEEAKRQKDQEEMQKKRERESRIHYG
jgi:hypothetical protein